MLILLGVVKGSSNLGNCLSWGWLKYRVKNAWAIASIRGTGLFGSSRGVRCAAGLCLPGERDLDPTRTGWEGGKEGGRRESGELPVEALSWAGGVSPVGAQCRGAGHCVVPSPGSCRCPGSPWGWGQ